MEGMIEALNLFLKADGIRIAQVLVTIVGGSIAIRAFCAMLLRISDHSSEIDGSAARYIITFLKLALYVLLGVAVLLELGMPSGTLLGQMGVIVAALALVLKDEISSLFNGLILVLNKPFVEGDRIQVDGQDALVRSITLFYTELVTFDNKVIHIPNADIVGSTIVNFNQMPIRRVEAVVGAAYGTDVDRAREVLLKAARGVSGVLRSPDPVCLVKTLNDSSVDLSVRVWTDARIQPEDTVFLLNEALYKAMNDAGLEIAFPQVDVHVRDAAPFRAAIVGRGEPPHE